MKAKHKGIFLASIGSAFWAISGIQAQALFQSYPVSAEWIVSTRLLIASIIILGFSYIKTGKDIFLPWKKKENAINLVLFAILGMAGVQYTYFKTVFYTGTAIATILQFTGPIFILLWLIMVGKRKFNILEAFLMFISFLGVAILSTGGKFGGLAISRNGFIIGILSAILFAFYSIISEKLTNQFPARIITGWGMGIASILFQFIHPITRPGFNLDIKSLSLMFGIILIGTILAFQLYLESLHYINPALASILTAFEPLLAFILSIPIFGTRPGLAEIISIILVVSSVIFLSIIDFSDVKGKEEVGVVDLIE